MRTIVFILIVSAILSIYGLANFYIYLRGLQALRPFGTMRLAYAGTFILLAISYIVSVFLERADIIALGKPLSWIGSFWIGAFVYLLLITAAVDLLRLVNHFAPFFPAFITSNPARAARVAAISALSVVVVLLVYGFVNAHIIRMRTFGISVPKETGSRKTLNIVMASDIHLSSIIGRSRIEHIVERINSLLPDLVLLPGDIVDGDLNPVIRQNLGEALRQIKAPLGVYAVTGNHEYIGGVEKACKYITDHDVKMLRDSTVFVDGSFYIVGREDRSAGKKRRSLKELMVSVNMKYPIILMNHQPFHLEEAEQNGVDLQFSGHTHHGQFWPFNYITDIVYKLSYGYIKKGSTHIYVSSGVGTWGPPLRIAADPEIVNIRMRFEK
ncbi:MAG: metallophosphoesterase [Bacteroidetes bacterium]|nr:metallophosphoesterase [Bacteroidota bacterium]MCL5737045.1 metallophosphoesterase [Bacteroidota bacterium]